jgi:protein farnesyltransferase/geranylgeranyltransferase type-1 subunit alpha
MTNPGETGELLSETPEWADVEPEEYPAEGRAAVDIQYTPEYEDAMGLLYAVIKKGELSKRVLKLTEKCIMLCPAHYTAWHWRYKVRFLSVFLF